MRSLRSRTRYGRLVTQLSLWADTHLNFYRVHLMAFTLIPTISAAVLYASNGRTKISYLDALFMCTSAMTSSGLNTINLSTTTVWQQVILAILMFIGNSTSVSLVVLFVRKSYFKSRCEDAVRMARQQRRERDLVRMKKNTVAAGAGIFDRVRTRAQTIFGWEPTPVIEPKPEAQEDGLGGGDKKDVGKSEEKGRVRGETITTTANEAVSSGPESDETYVGGENRVQEKAANGNGHADANGHSTPNGNHHPLPPTFTQTAPTPSPTLGVLPEVGVTDSPAEELADPVASNDVNGLTIDPAASKNIPADRSRPRPRSLALGHESDRNVRHLRERAGVVRVGQVEVWGNDAAARDGNTEERKDGKGEERKGEARDRDESAYPTQVETTSPTELSQHVPSPNTQFSQHKLSPTQKTFAASPNDVSEFQPSNPSPHAIPPQAAASPAPTHATLSSPGPGLRKNSLSSPASRSKKLSSPFVRPAYLQGPSVVGPRARRTTFAEQVHPHQHHHHHPLHHHDRATTMSADNRRAALRARNGTITSPMPHYSQLATPSHMSTHLESDTTQSQANSGTDLLPPPAQPHQHIHSHPYTHVPHPTHVHIPQLAYPHVPRPRAHTGQGGFSSPFELAARYVTHVPAVKRFVGAHEKEVVKETEGRGRRGSVYMRMGSDPDTGGGAGGEGDVRDVDEVSLEDEDLEEMGGDEYNALVVLSWIVAGHYLLHHAIAFVILAPYSAKVPLVRDVITAQNESSHTKLNPTWFALFSVISAYANAGLTVVDTSLTEMSSAYVMIFVIMWLILVGAAAFPLSLRFFVWVGTKIFKHGSTAKGLKFLLKHPRRCFMYMFPSHQSWYLLFTLVVIFLIDWVAYLTFNIGMPGIEAVPIGPRVVGGLLQAAGQRAGGFTTINLQAIAPALQVVYIATMFVQVYPIAMAVRTSNVYEDSGVVIYEADDEDEPTNLPTGRGAGFTAYVGWHLKHQLAQDLFWLIAALTALCAFERARILDDETHYFNIFSIFFEIVSAFANVGFSLGVATQPYSLSGEMRTIPKLVIICLMIRGRHRGLPMAIDRAVQLPTEYKTNSRVTTTSGASSRRSTVGAMSRRPTVGTYTRTSVRQRQRAQDPTLSSDDEE